MSEIRLFTYDIVCYIVLHYASFVCIPYRFWAVTTDCALLNCRASFARFYPPAELIFLSRFSRQKFCSSC